MYYLTSVIFHVELFFLSVGGIDDVDPNITICDKNRDPYVLPKLLFGVEN